MIRSPILQFGDPTRRQLLKSLGALGLGPALSALPSSTAFAAMTGDSVNAVKGPVNVLGSQPYEVRDTWPKDLQVTWAYNTTNEDILTKTTQAGTFDLVIIYQGEIDQ